jgi:serine protease 16
MTLIKNIVVLSAIGSAVSTDSFQPASLGFGVQRLKNFKSRGGPLKETTTCPEVAQYWYKDAVIDNFAPIQNQKKWEGEGQRYWLNREFWGGVDFPIFVYIGGEGAESCSRLTNRMYAYQLAQQHQALLVDVEHRFYGESYPTADMSTKNLQHLSADQALADLARIIGHIKSDLNTASSKVVTIGGSYPGNLAAWFRLKYPSVTQGSIASSAPVLAQTNFYAYMDVVGQSIIHFSGQACFDAFESAAKTLASYAEAGNYAQLEKDFNTCNPIGSTNDLKVLLSDLMGNVQGTIQYNNEHSGVMNVTDICGTMQQSTDYYANFIALQALYRQANGQSCEDASYADTIAYLSNPEKDANNNGRPWTYQTCNEFGYFQTADSKVCSVSTFNRMLSWNLY